VYIYIAHFETISNALSSEYILSIFRYGDDL